MLSNIVVAFKGQRLQLKLALGAILVDPDSTLGASELVFFVFFGPKGVLLTFIVVSGEIL